MQKKKKKQRAKLRSNATHTQPTPTLKTPHTPRHPHSNTSTYARKSPSSRHYSHFTYIRGCIAKQAHFLTIKCKHNSLSRLQSNRTVQKDIVSLSLWRPHNWGTECQLRSGAATPLFESHITMASIPNPPACEISEIPRNFLCRKSNFH